MPQKKVMFCNCQKKISTICFSGGLDSTSLLLHLLNKKFSSIYEISFNYGQKHILELKKASKNIKYLNDKGFEVYHKILDISDISTILESSLIKDNSSVPKGYYMEESMKSTVVPNRNSIFLSLLFAYSLSLYKKYNNKITMSLGVHTGDHAIYPDCRPEFYGALENAFQIGNWSSDKVSFYLPYIGGDKESILRDSEKSLDALGLDFDTLFANTNTSYDPDEIGRSSGKSGADVERILAFHAVGKEDPVPYVKPWPEVLQDAINTEAKRK